MMRLRCMLVLLGLGVGATVLVMRSRGAFERHEHAYRGWTLRTEPAEGGWTTWVFDPAGNLTGSGFAPEVQDPPSPGEVTYEGLIGLFHEAVDRAIATGSAVLEESGFG